MAECKAGNCDAICDGGCACIALASDPSVCTCICEELLTAKVKTGALHKITPDSKVNIHARNIPIANLAWLFDRILPDEIAIPPGQSLKRITIKQKDKLFTELVTATGLVLLKQMKVK